MSNPTPPPLIAETRTSIPAALLSLVLALFFGSALISLLDDSLLLFFNRQDLTMTRGLLLVVMLFAGGLTYLLMALIPGIPKRIFLPVALFLPVSCVAVLPLLVYFHSHAAWFSWGISLLQVHLGYFLIRNLKRGSKIQWPLFTDERIQERGFRWNHFVGMILAGFLLILPALVLYTLFSAKLAVDHFTDGFVRLGPSGVTMQVRQYVRDDGKNILLVPMSHVGEQDFYQNLSESFPEDAVVLMEGVSDNKNVVATHTNYSKMAESIGVVEQQKVFKPKGEIVAADMDMSDFSPTTLEVLKTALLVHSKGVTPETLPILMKPTPPGFEKQLLEDILTKRNQHLLKVLKERLPGSNHIVIPWGAAHMPEIAREILKSGFRVSETREYLAIRFGS